MAYDSELLMLSGLQHVLFCERQFALIHIEQVWSENYLTAKGRVMHEKVHEASVEQRGRVRITRALPLVSHKLGLVGQADVVEFHRVVKGNDGITLPGIKGQWSVFPVEYKLGKPKSDQSDDVQLCAQALCLEEMLHTNIPDGALFYGKPRRRQQVSFTDELRKLTIETSKRIHDLFASGSAPPAVFEKKCKSCSLLDICLPKKMENPGKVKRYIQKIMDEVYAQNAE
jgi:CRISPR-associated exonuclease Cas4